MEVKVHCNGIVSNISFQEGEILLQGLRKNGFDLYSPCGGNGTCGKCEVLVKSEGVVTSCVYKVKAPIEVVLPDKRESNILIAQHDYTIQLPLMPGICADLSYYPHGVAIDIGTTTVVFYLVNLVTGTIVETRSMLNPQSKYGGDVISRLQYVCDNTEGLKTLQHEIIEAFNQQLTHLTHFAEITSEEIVKITVAGNTVMLHFLLGADVKSLATYPFTPQFINELILNGAGLKLKCHPEAEVKILPSVSAFIGADILAGLASIAPSEKYKKYLFVDIGTNGELALVSDHAIFCCSTAAGPAFEGASITCGMVALEGAISAFDGNRITVIGNEKPAGLCGSGLVDVVAYLVASETISSEGLLENDFIIVSAAESATGKDILLNQKDVREVQLAKAALAAGIKLLMKNAALTFGELDALFLAGGFGNYLNVESAMQIGLLPPEMKDKIIPIGNSSGVGAIEALKSVRFDEALQNVLSKTRLIDLAAEEDFAVEFAMNMLFAKNNLLNE